MCLSTRQLAIIPALLIAAASSALAAESPATVVTEHYLVQSHAGKPLADLIASQMERMFSEYVARLGVPKQKTDGRSTIIVHATQEGYIRDVGQGNAHSGGMYSSAREALITFSGDRGEAEILATLYHEGFHQFTFEYNVSPVMPWLNEGMAELFGAARWNGSKFIFGEAPLARIRSFQRAAQKGQLLPLPELIALPEAEWALTLHKSLDEGNLIYAEGWALVHYLIYSGEADADAGLAEYMKLTESGENSVKSFQKSFGKSPIDLQPPWVQYVIGLPPSPKDVCKENLLYIGNLYMIVKKMGRQVLTMADLKSAALDDRRLHWEISSSTGEKFTEKSRAEVEKWFHCAEAKGSKSTSYRLDFSNAKGANWPRIICDHDAGLQLIVRFVNDPQQKMMKPVVEEQILSASPPRTAENAPPADH